MSSLSSDKDLAEVLRLFFLLLDLSRDVERNKEDAAFRAEGGIISYVFDANVQEVFINPHDRRGQLTSLHSEDWRNPNQRTPNWDSYVAQTALCTSEYLIAGNLPGQERDRLYMTEWHRWEFKRRFDVLRREQAIRLQTANEASVLRRFDRVTEIMSLLEVNSDSILTYVDDSELVEDLKRFSVFDSERQEFGSYLRTRLYLNVLANDRVVEPAEQLRRLVTAPLRNSFATLHLSFRPDEAQQRDIFADSQVWFRRLVSECAASNIAVALSSNSVIGGDFTPRREPRRSAAALWDDARSVALVRWAATDLARKSSSRRVVFVTADQLLFDAYRRWYSDLSPGDDAYTEPFFMRRISQYAPVFNLVDSGQVEGEQYRRLFQDILQVLEVLLLPLNLSRSASKAPDTVVTRMREMTTLRAKNGQAIDGDIAYMPLVAALSGKAAKDYRTSLANTIDRWRELERAALGSANELVERRVEAVEQSFDEPTGGRTREAFEQYVTNLVGTLLSGSHELSLPLAREFIDDWRPPAGNAITRAPIALRLSVETTRGSLPVGEILEDRLSGNPSGPLVDEDGWVALIRKPALVFTIAAAQQVVTRDWNNAHHFSEMALLADSEVATTAGVVTGDAAGDQTAEIKYLAALVRRFRIGESGPPLTAESLNRIQRNYRAASSLLSECEEYHSHRNEAQTLRVMRTRSERAALNLFYTICLNPAVRLAAHTKWRHVGAKRDRGNVAQDRGLIDFDLDAVGVRALEAAEQDLRSCMELDANLGEIQEVRRKDFLYRLQRQYYTNIAAAGVMRHLWNLDLMGADRVLRPTSDEAVSRVSSVLERYGDSAHPVMRAESLAFLVLGGDGGAKRELEKLRPLEAEVGVLLLDVAIVDTIIRAVSSFENPGPDTATR